jgi:rod shape-determining protein MreB
MDRLRRHHGLIIGAPTAERLKIELGSAIEPKDAARTLTVKGRDVQMGTPRAADVTSDEVCGVVQGVVQRIARVVQRGVAELSPEVAADIYDRGLILTGGGALLDGMPAFLQSETRLAARLAENPRHAIVNGLSQLFDDPLLLRRVTRNEPSLLLDGDAGAFEI